MCPLAVLTSDRINRGVFYKEMYDRFAGPKKSGRNNEVTGVPLDMLSLHCSC